MLNYIIDGDIERIKFAREAAKVDRAHTTHFIGEYNVGLHTHNMLSMLRILFPEAPAYLIWAIHEHDIAERLSGDIPSPSKSSGIVDKAVLQAYEIRINFLIYNSCSVSKLTPTEHGWLKGLDMLELFCWTKDQLKMGNSNVISMKDRIFRSFKNNQAAFPLPVVDMFYLVDKSEWKLMPELGDFENDSE